MKTVKTSLGRLGVMLLSLALCLAMLPSAAFAADSSGDTSADTSVETVETEKEETTTTGSKKLTVGSDEDYTTIQSAINAIYKENDPTGWTIIVETGTYAPFAVPKTVTGLTVQAANSAKVTIKTWDSDYKNQDYVSSHYRTDGYGEAFYGVYVQAQNLSIDGIDFVIGTAGSAWYKSGIHDAGSYGEYISTGLSVSNCTFSKNESVTSQTQGILNCSSKLTVTGCKFDDLTFAVYMCGDNQCADGVSITGNTFTDCENACVIYFGGGLSDGASGTVTFSNNVVTGSADEYSSVAIEDLNDKGSIETVVIKGNTFTYSVIGLVAVPTDAYDSLSDKNSCDEYSIGIYTAISALGANNVEFKFLSPSEDEGYWVFDETVFNSKTSIYQDSDAAKAAIEAAIDAANANSSRTLTVTLDMSGYPKQLIENNCILWVSGTMPTEKQSQPGLEKKIVSDGTEVDQDDVAAGDTVTFQLTSNVPSTLDEYIDYTYSTSGTVGTVKDSATYTLTFHDEMDKELSLNENSFAVYVGETELDADDYTVTTSGLTDDCTFEVSVDLLELYTNEIITESDFGFAEITVTYTATLSKGAEAGTYTNTAWVAYPDDTSAQDTVEVDTYGLSIFKYDQAPVYSEDGSQSYTGLSGAVFTLYSDEECTTAVATLTSDGDGYADYSGLDAGTYYLKETSAPTGYVMSNVTVEIVLPDDADKDSNVVSVNFANSAVPSTGGAGTTMYTAAGICIILAAGLALVVTRKKREA